MIKLKVGYAYVNKQNCYLQHWNAVGISTVAFMQVQHKHNLVRSMIGRVHLICANILYF